MKSNPCIMHGTASKKGLWHVDARTCSGGSPFATTGGSTIVGLSSDRGWLLGLSGDLSSLRTVQSPSFSWHCCTTHNHMRQAELLQP